MWLFDNPKVNSFIGSNQLDETSTTLSSSIDLIPIAVFLYLLWFHLSSSFLQGLFCKKTTSWHYKYSILSDFPCIPSSIMIMDLLLLLPNHHVSHLHASSVLKYTFVEVKHEFYLVLLSEYCGCFPQLCFFSLMNLHLVFRFFKIRHFLTRIPLPLDL